jgi:hypothetical protein
MKESREHGCSPSLRHIRGYTSTTNLDHIDSGVLSRARIDLVVRANCRDPIACDRHGLGRRAVHIHRDDFAVTQYQIGMFMFNRPRAC